MPLLHTILLVTALYSPKHAEHMAWAGEKMAVAPPPLLRVTNDISWSYPTNLSPFVLFDLWGSRDVRAARMNRLVSGIPGTNRSVRYVTTNCWQCYFCVSARWKD